MFNKILRKSCSVLNFQRHDSCKLTLTWLLHKHNWDIQVISKYATVPKKADALHIKTFSMFDPLLGKYAEYLVQEYDKATQDLLNGQKSENEKRKANVKLVQTRPAVQRFKEFLDKKMELEDLKEIIQGGEDDSLVQMAKREMVECQEDLEQLDNEILFHLVPPEKGDDNDVIFEVLAGVGGQEAMLFTEEIWKMYMNYAAFRDWQFEIISQDKHEIGAIRKASAIIRGQSVYQWLKYEGGVHRVQRVPRTEKSGRIHTSTMTVAVMPQPSDIDVVINPKEIKVDTFRASGAGGQHVNTTESAVRITHIPSGIVSECQAGRSQLKNRETALQVLSSRLYQKELEAQTTKFRTQRKLQVGSAGRSEKIRTYNFSQDRITDHRIGQNMHNIQDFLTGGEALDSMMEELQQVSRKERLAELVDTWINDKR